MNPRQWNWVTDITGDGKVTISDVWGWMGWLYYWPGDFFIQYLIGTELGVFFEFTYSDYGGTFSFIISGLVWLITLFMIAGALFATIEYINEEIKYYRNMATMKKAREERERLGQEEEDSP